MDYIYIFISKTNEINIFPYKDNYITGFTEYGLRYDNIRVNNLAFIPKEVSIKLNNILLCPSTHITNLWHLLHHLYTTYKFIIINKLTIKNIYPVFFKNTALRQGNLLECQYNELIFTGMGFDYKLFKDIVQKFSKGKCISADKIYVDNQSINFTSEPLFDNFKKHILTNFGLTYEKTPHNIITFILRRGTREITNINDVKKYLLNYKINYIYLEDHSICEQLKIISNTDILLGVHGAGLSWSIFMKSNSHLIEMFPGNNSNTDYIRFCNLAKIKYTKLSINISSGHNKDFREMTTNINTNQLNNIKILLDKYDL